MGGGNYAGYSGRGAGPKHGDAFKASLAGALTHPFRDSPDQSVLPSVLIVGWNHLLAPCPRGGGATSSGEIQRPGAALRFADFVQKIGVKDDSAGVIANIVKWFVRLITLVVAFDTLGLPAVSNVLQQLLLWLPNWSSPS